MNEKRGTERVELHLDLKNSSDQVIVLKNVSGQGLCVISNEPYDIGRYFSRRFILPNGSSINILGKVVWQKMKKRNEYESGIKFISLGSTDREYLTQYISKEHKKKKKA